MKYQGNILKLRTEFNNPIEYYFVIGNTEFNLNTIIGKNIKMEFTGQINCILCGKSMKKSIGTGICYNCNQTRAEADESVFRPELSKSQYGIYRDAEYAKTHDLIDHFVYLAESGELKVGVTRNNQIPTRWIDQGANRAIKIAQTPNRHIAGIIEIFLKNYISDKTNWRTMLLSNLLSNIDLISEKQKALDLLPAELKKYTCTDNNIVTLQYPIENFPDIITNTSFDKERIVEGKLTGVKGQYMYIDNTKVINIRKHSGYYIKIEHS